MIALLNTNISYSSSHFQKRMSAKKKKIPAIIKEEVWFNYIGDRFYGLCLCCNKRRISALYFHCGHIISEHNGGNITIDNLIPLCGQCNNSMYTKNLFDFMKEYNLSIDHIIPIYNKIKSISEFKSNNTTTTQTTTQTNNIKPINQTQVIDHKSNNISTKDSHIIWCKITNSSIGICKKYGPYGHGDYFKYKWSCCHSQAENPIHHIKIIC